jgi:hypothetical protein
LGAATAQRANADPHAWLLLKLVLRPFAETLADTWGFSAHVRSYIIDAIAGRCAVILRSTRLYCQCLLFSSRFFLLIAVLIGLSFSSSFLSPVLVMH